MQKTNKIDLIAEVDNILSGCRFDVAAKKLFDEYSRANLQKWILSGNLTIDGKLGKPKQQVFSGQKLQLSVKLASETTVKPQAIPLSIVFEDDDILIINKPSDLVVHPGAGNLLGTLQNALLHYLPEIETVPRCGIVHRLDKNTSGLLVVAKNLISHCKLVEALQLRKVSRHYLAIVKFGNSSSHKGTVAAPIARHPTNRVKMAIVKNGKSAVTHYTTIASIANYKLLLLQLESGRTHQIRVHLQSIKLPIVGDQTYAPAAVAKLHHRQLLHAYSLQFKHPTTNKKVKFIARPPADFINWASAEQLTIDNGQLTMDNGR